VTPKWWNAALYDHNTGKPYAAFYELKNFLAGGTGISSLDADKADDPFWYSLDGRRMNSKPQAKGIYLNNGKKIIINEK
jgi:arabinogalactan endo-1,4-beta-galactosidase